jgi:PAS domain S-box-containing protein
VPSTASDALELDQASMEELEREAFIPVQPGALPAAPWVRYLFSMRVKGRLRAVLAIAEREPPEEPLSTEDRALLGTLAAHAATAIEAARLVLEVRQRADEIERLHERQAKILESSAVGLLLLDAEDRIQAWNRALEEIYGLQRDAALGRRLSEVFPLHVVRRIEHEVGAREASGETRIFRLGMVNKKGNRVMVNLAISPVDREDEGRSAKVVTFDDVTRRVKLEEQVLRQERLASLGLLAAGVAHEINTPLTGISSYAQMLLEELDEEDPRKEVLEKIEAQTRRASGITSSLLNLSRPEETSLEPLDLNRLIGEVLQLFEPQVRGREIRLGVELDEKLAPVLGHKGKLQQVFLNLLINARDAVGREGEITVATFARDGKAVVEVTDDGVGIAEEDLLRIFDPFFTTKGRGKGTGLGLSISYGIVHEHQGELHVESHPGARTRFSVELPTARAERLQEAGP